LTVCVKFNHDNAASTDRPPGSNTAPVPHDATTTANAIANSTSNTKSKKRGSRPAFRRQRKRAAAAAGLRLVGRELLRSTLSSVPVPDPSIV